MNRIVLILLACVLAVGLSSQVSAADGNVSDGLLADMGLSGLQPMTDSDGDQIRGKGFVVVKGFSYAGGSFDHYFKVRSNFAIGGSFASSGGYTAGGFSAAFAY